MYLYFSSSKQQYGQHWVTWSNYSVMLVAFWPNLSFYITSHRGLIHTTETLHELREHSSLWHSPWSLQARLVHATPSQPLLTGIDSFWVNVVKPSLLEKFTVAYKTERCYSPISGLPPSVDIWLRKQAETESSPKITKVHPQLNMVSFPVEHTWAPLSNARTGERERPKVSMTGWVWGCR